MNSEAEKRDFTPEVQLNTCKALMTWRIEEGEAKRRKYAEQDGIEFAPIPEFWKDALVEVNTRILNEAIIAGSSEETYASSMSKAPLQTGDVALGRLLEFIGDQDSTITEFKIQLEIESGSRLDDYSLEEDRMLVLGAVWFGIGNGEEPASFFRDEEKYTEIQRKIQTPDEFVRRWMRRILKASGTKRLEEVSMRMKYVGRDPVKSPEEVSDPLRETYLHNLANEVERIWGPDTLDRFIPSLIEFLPQGDQ